MVKSLTYRNLQKAAKVLIFGIAMSLSASIFAAKGDSKTKKGVVLKFTGFELKSFYSGSMLSKPGFVYRGSMLNYDKAPQQTTLNSTITFQKGNTTFIYPYKHKVAVPMPKFKTPQQPQ